jgi:cytidine deaminase
MKIQELIQQAYDLVNPRKLGEESWSGSVGCALETETGNVFRGVCIDVPSGMGFCAEHSAIAAMITAGEYKIKRIVAVYQDGQVIPPCGRCREFMRQIHPENLDAEVIIARDNVVPLRELLPYHDWLEG